MSENNKTPDTEVEEVEVSTATGPDMEGNPATDHVAEHAIAATQTQTVTSPKGNAYITQLLDNIMQDFIEANNGLDMDFVYMGSWLVMNKKGQFVEKDDDSVNYGDYIDVVMGQGEKRWSLWGKQNSPEDGQLIVACRERADAEAMLNDWLYQNPEAVDRYSLESLELRYMAFVVPVQSISEDMPQIYLMSFSPTSTIAFGKYAMKVYKGGYKAVGIKPRTGLTAVVTRLTSVEQQSRKDASISWLGIEFDAMGMFVPTDFQKADE